MNPHPISHANHKREDTYEDDIPETTGREEQVDPGLDLGHLDVKTRRDHARLVQSTIQLNDDFSGAVVINYFEFTDVACRGGVDVSSKFTNSSRKEGQWAIAKEEHSPWRCMTLRNLTTTLDEGRISTWRLPRRSALTMLFCDTV